MAPTGGAGEGTLALGHGVIRLPAFLPDATQGTVRSLDAGDLATAGVQAVMMNVFHLMQRPGPSTIRALGGLHGMFGWSGPIMTDSGGFQAYSLIRENPRYGTLTDRGMIFRPEGARERITLTPEKSISLQMAFGADVVVCLDDCTSAEEPLEEQRAAVRRTVAWAARCKEEYARRAEQAVRAGREAPRLFAVVQGGNEPDLRRECADRLLEIGFDGYGLGGWPLDAQGNLLTDIIGLTRALIPAQFPVHALGVGHPEHILACYRMGYRMFDSSMPTRDARHARFLVLDEARAAAGFERGWFSYLYAQDEKHYRDGRPLDEKCDCPACARYSRAYLHHLFKTGDTLFQRLATLHNLRFMTRFMAILRGEAAVPHGA